MDMKSEYSYDVIVIGAGPGGVTAASLLANSGKKVLLVEKNKKPGGRMLTINRDGFSYELFPINCVPCRNSLFEKLSATLGKENDVKTIYNDETGGVGITLFEGPDGVVREFDMHSGLNEQFMTDMGAKTEDDMMRVGAMFKDFATMPEEEINKLYSISAMSYMEKYKDVPVGIYTYFLACFGEGMFEMTSDKVPAAEMVKMFQQVIRDGGGRYYEGGIGYFFEVMARAVEENGGTLLRNC